jgi:hypothetical protein
MKTLMIVKVGGCALEVQPPSGLSAAAMRSSHTSARCTRVAQAGSKPTIFLRALLAHTQGDVLALALADGHSGEWSPRENVRTFLNGFRAVLIRECNQEPVVLAAWENLDNC